MTTTTIINWLNIEITTYSTNKHTNTPTLLPNPTDNLNTTVSPYLTRHHTYTSHSLRYNQAMLKSLSALIGSYAQINHIDPLTILTNLTPLHTTPPTHTTITQRFNVLTGTTYSPTYHYTLIRRLYTYLLTHLADTTLPTPGVSSTLDATPWAV